MTMKTKNDIFKEHLAEYLKADKGDKGKILDHVCFVTRIHRKAAMRKLRRLQLKNHCQEEKRGREVFYTRDVVCALKELWEISGRVCGELLHPQVKEYAEALVRDKMWKHGNEATDKLFFMSLATVKRRLNEFTLKEGVKRKGWSATKPSHLKMIVPVFKGPWENKPAGYGQIDTVVHCGHTLFGDYAYTCNYTDAKTLWLAPRAQWNKGAEATKGSMEHIKERLPFPWLGSHSDTGNEFINQAVVPWCLSNGIEPTRSRPNRKNDNMYVEERNGHVIRKYVGYQRLDCLEAVAVLNELYEALQVYLNHFIAVRRCVEKTRVGSKYIRKYEREPKTPYRRVLEEKTVSKEVKDNLMKIHSTLNPLVLHEEIERLKKKLYDTEKRHGKS